MSQSMLPKAGLAITGSIVLHLALLGYLSSGPEEAKIAGGRLQVQFGNYHAELESLELPSAEEASEEAPSETPEEPEPTPRPQPNQSPKRDLKTARRNLNQCRSLSRCPNRVSNKPCSPSQSLSPSSRSLPQKHRHALRNLKRDLKRFRPPRSNQRQARRTPPKRVRRQPLRRRPCRAAKAQLILRLK